MESSVLLFKNKVKNSILLPPFLQSYVVYSPMFEVAYSGPNFVPIVVPFSCVKVKSIQRPRTEAIRTQIEPSKPKRENKSKY